MNAIAAAEAAAHPELAPSRLVVDYPVDPYAHLYGVVPGPDDSPNTIKAKAADALYKWMAKLGLGPYAKHR